MKFPLALPLVLAIVIPAGAAVLQVPALSIEGAGGVSAAGAASIFVPTMPAALSAAPSLALMPAPSAFATPPSAALMPLPAAAAPASPAQIPALAAALPNRAAFPAASAPANDGGKSGGDERPSAVGQLHEIAAAWAKGEPDADFVARGALEQARSELYQAAGGGADGSDVSRAKISLAQRTEYFRSPAFHNWVAAEKAAGRQVFWLKDIDKTQASGDVFTYFFRWRALNGKITPAQNETMRAFLKTVAVKDPGLKAELAAVDANDAKTNALLVIKLWRNQEHGGEGIGLLDFWSKIYWPTQKGLTRAEKLAQAAAFAPTYAPKVYPGVPEENRALTAAGVEAVAVSNGDQELAVAVAGQLGLKPENIVGSNLTYDAAGLATGVNHGYEIFDKEWSVKPQPGKQLLFHYWIHQNKAHWGWSRLDKSRVVIAGADGDSAATDGGMWVYFPDKAIGNFMIDTPHEPGRVVKSRALAEKYGWDASRFFTLTHSADSPSDWDDVPPKR